MHGSAFIFQDKTQRHLELLAKHYPKEELNTNCVKLKSEFSVDAIHYTE